MPASNVMLAGIQRSRRAQRYSVEEWFNLPPAPPPTFDPTTVPADELYQQPSYALVRDNADEWYAFLPPAPVAFDPQAVPLDEMPQVAASLRIYDDSSDSVVQIFLPPFDVEDARVVMAPPPQADLPWDVLPIFLPPFVIDLQAEPKTKRDYMWLEPVTLEDWLQPPAAQIVNTTANGRSTRLGLLFPAMR